MSQAACDSSDSGPGSPVTQTWLSHRKPKLTDSSADDKSPGKEYHLRVASGPECNERQEVATKALTSTCEEDEPTKDETSAAMSTVARATEIMEQEQQNSWRKRDAESRRIFRGMCGECNGNVFTDQVLTLHRHDDSYQIRETICLC